MSTLRKTTQQCPEKLNKKHKFSGNYFISDTATEKLSGVSLTFSTAGQMIFAGRKIYLN